MEPSAIPRCRNALDSTWTKSERKTDRDLVTDGEKRDTDKQSQLRRADEERKGQTAVAAYGYSLLCPRARRGLSERASE